MARKFIFLGFLLLPLLFSAVSAQTTCYPASPGECKILIVVDIAFAYNPSQVSWDTIKNWVNEAEGVWNGYTYGDCNCIVEFQINAVNITNQAQINCNPGPPGYHCVMITDYSQNPPTNEARNETYRAYMYGVSQGGASINGWWSTEMGKPHPNSPTGENALDAAHEVGHMLGLGDDYDKGPPPRYGRNIMGTTHGPDAKPTQEQINTVVENNCGEGACPDGCCCGNGALDGDKGETCDPMADPTGCPGGQYCCRICCNCHEQACDPELGSYATKEDCKTACKDGDCYHNYNTGCWDCKRRSLIATPTSAKTPTPSGGASGIAPLIFIAVGLAGGVAGAATKNRFLIGSGVALIAAGGLLLVLVPLEVPPATSLEPYVPLIQPLVLIGQPAGPAPEPTPLAKVDEPILEYEQMFAGNLSGNLSGNVPKSECGDGKCEKDENCATCGDCACAGDNICGVGSDRVPHCMSPPVCQRHCFTEKGADCNCSLGHCRCPSGYVCCNPHDRDCEPNRYGCALEKTEREPYCGDRNCDFGEDCRECPSDCGACKPSCGDGKCEAPAGENCECPDCECPIGLYCRPDVPDADQLGCSPASPGAANCGNGECEETEYCYTCPQDCKCGPETCCSPSNPGIGCGADCSWTPN